MRGRCSFVQRSAVVMRVPSAASNGSGSGRLSGFVAPFSAAEAAVSDMARHRIRRCGTGMLMGGKTGRSAYQMRADMLETLLEGNEGIAGRVVLFHDEPLAAAGVGLGDDGGKRQRA